MLRATPSRLRGGARVGADFFERRGVARPSPEVRGLVDDLARYGHEDLDVARIPAEIRAFFTDTASLALHIESEWHGVFAWLWPVARLFLRVVGQFVLPVRHGEISTRAVAIDTERDGRSDARGIVRTYPDGLAMQTVAYATHQRAGVGYMSASFPLPFSALLGVLRLDATGDDPALGLSVALNSTPRESRDDDSGVWLTTALGSVRLPFNERLAFWTPAMSACPKELAARAMEGVTLVARHEQRMFGWLVVTHRYWFTPVRG